MNSRVNEITNVIENIRDIKVVKQFEDNGELIEGDISVFIQGLKQPLQFHVIIYPQYPFKSHSSETIKFINRDLLENSHIMGNGAICIHTAHSPNLSQKLIYDIESVKVWISKYHIGKESDNHYEHLIVPQKSFKGNLFAYFFNEVDYDFYKTQYGYVDYSTLSNGSFHNNKITSNIIQKFKDKNGKELVAMKWSTWLKSLSTNIGLFIFLKSSPSKNNRWVFEKWEELNKLLPQDFLHFLHSVEKKYSKNKGNHLPLLVGYNISDYEIHWQVIMLELGNFPIYPIKENQRWLTEINGERDINWAITRNCSYNYLFGRGRLSDKFINSRILIIGIGAIGSIVAKTLVRCGCTKIDFIDYDVKEPENVCRSEYTFASGINNKTSDLVNELYLISPFFEPFGGGYKFSEAFDFFTKSGFTDTKTKSELEEYINNYDFIIDCSADNDLLYVLSQLRITSLFINLSISNHAKQLVCAAEGNRYEFVSTQFSGTVLKFDIDDLYNPTGCWSPTFKASYNDINMLVQFAIKQIDLKFKQDKALRNFVLEVDDSNSLIINTKEF